MRSTLSLEIVFVPFSAFYTFCSVPAVTAQISDVFWLRFIETNTLIDHSLHKSHVKKSDGESLGTEVGRQRYSHW